MHSTWVNGYPMSYLVHTYNMYTDRSKVQYSWNRTNTGTTAYLYFWAADVNVTASYSNHTESVEVMVTLKVSTRYPSNLAE